MRVFIIFLAIFSPSESLTVKKYCEEILAVKNDTTPGKYETMIADWCRTFIKIKHGLKEALENREKVDDFIGLTIGVDELGSSSTQRSGNFRLASISKIPVLQLLTGFSDEVEKEEQEEHEIREKLKLEREKERERRRERRKNRSKKQEPSTEAKDKVESAKNEEINNSNEKLNKLGKTVNNRPETIQNSSSPDLNIMSIIDLAAIAGRPEQPEGREKECYKRNNRWKCPCSKRRNGKWKCKKPSSFARRG